MIRINTATRTGHQRSCSVPENRAISREIADECQVLLKNENNLLPLKKSGRIAVIGPLGDAASDMPGCWSLTGKADQSVSLYQGLKTAIGANGTVYLCKGKRSCS